MLLEFCPLCYYEYFDGVEGILIMTELVIYIIINVLVTLFLTYNWL